MADRNNNWRKRKEAGLPYIDRRGFLKVLGIVGLAACTGEAVETLSPTQNVSPESTLIYQATATPPVEATATATATPESKWNFTPEMQAILGQDAVVEVDPATGDKKVVISLGEGVNTPPVFENTKNTNGEWRETIYSSFAWAKFIVDNVLPQVRLTPEEQNFLKNLDMGGLEPVELVIDRLDPMCATFYYANIVDSVVKKLVVNNIQVEVTVVFVAIHSKDGQDYKFAGITKVKTPNPSNQWATRYALELVDNVEWKFSDYETPKVYPEKVYMVNVPVRVVPDRLQDLKNSLGDKGLSSIEEYITWSMQSGISREEAVQSYVRDVMFPHWFTLTLPPEPTDNPFPAGADFPFPIISIASDSPFP